MIPKQASLHACKVRVPYHREKTFFPSNPLFALFSRCRYWNCTILKDYQKCIQPALSSNPPLSSIIVIADQIHTYEREEKKKFAAIYSVEIPTKYNYEGYV